MLDWSRTTESVKKERIEKCLEYIRRITNKRQLVSLLCDIVIYIRCPTISCDSASSSQRLLVLLPDFVD